VGTSPTSDARPPVRVVEAVTDALYHRLVGTGDVWRTRAATTAGFLATAGATLVAGLLLRGPEDLTPATRLSGVVAIVGFVLGAAALTIAAMHTPPKPPRDATPEAFVKEALKLVEDDRNAVWPWMAAGRIAGGIALVATAATLALAVYDTPVAPHASIVLTDSGLAAARSLCPAAQSQLTGRVADRNGRFVLTLDAPCAGHYEFTFRAADVVAVAYDG
jgi:hypothetical protein